MNMNIDLWVCNGVFHKIVDASTIMYTVFSHFLGLKIAFSLVESNLMGLYTQGK